MADKAHDMPPLSNEQMAELEANGVITLAPHACGRADAQLAEYNYGRPDGPIDYRVHCHGCRIVTFPFETPQEAFAAWHRHLALTGANEIDRLRAREEAAMAIVREVARQDDRNDINCACREMMPVGHSSDCYVFRAHMMAHQLPDGSYE